MTSKTLKPVVGDLKELNSQLHNNINGGLGSSMHKQQRYTKYASENADVTSCEKLNLEISEILMNAVLRSPL